MPERDALDIGDRRPLREADDVTDRRGDMYREKFQRERDWAALEDEMKLDFSLQPVSSCMNKKKKKQ
jgi:hypothetical protein